MRSHPLYKVWLGMRNRCNNPNTLDFPYYGGRGIFVSPRWNSFANFLADMGERPTPKHTVDRINNNGPYAWWNCRWATRAFQGRNQRSNRVITFAGETMVMADWCRRFGITQSCLHGAIKRHGEQLAVERAHLRSQGVKLRKIFPPRKARA